MAEIEIDIKIPSAEAINVDSPFLPQDVNIVTTNIIERNVDLVDVRSTGDTIPYLIGAQGPQGPMGIPNTGELDLRYYSINNPSGFITGVDLSSYLTSSTAASTYATKTNLELTGSNLQTQINNLDNTYATDSALASTGSTLVQSINSLNTTLTNDYYLKSNPSGFITGVDLSSYLTSSNASITYATISNLALTGSNLQNQINNLDNTYATDTALSTAETNLNNKINALSGSAVLIYGNQTIAGAKDFTTRPTVNLVPVALSGEASSAIEQYVKNDEGKIIYKGQPVYVNGSNGNNILIKLAGNTGERTSSKTFGLAKDNIGINEFGYIVTEGAINQINTSSANEGDPIWLGPTGDLIFGLVNKPYAPNHLVSLGFVERKHQNQGKIFVKIQNGFELEELHNVNINHSYTLNNDNILRYDTSSGLWFNKPLNTGIFQDQISLLSGSAVLRYGNQIVNGTKYFNNSVYIKDLYVTGTEFITNTQNNFVQSPYLVLNLTGGAIDGGIFFVTGLSSGSSGVPLTGFNDMGPIIGFDHSKKFKFGVSTRASDLSSLNDIAAFQDLTAYSGFVDNKYVTKTNGQFNDRPTVNGTGVLLSGEAANVDLSSVIQITGDQNVSGIKNFYSRPTVNGTGILLSGESAGALEKRHDFVTGNLYDFSYCGTASQNSLESASVWNITRLSIGSAGLVAFNQSVTNYSWTGRYLAPYV